MIEETNPAKVYKKKQDLRWAQSEADEKDVADHIDLSSLRPFSSEDEIPLNYIKKPTKTPCPIEYFYNPKIDAIQTRFVDEFPLQEKVATSKRYRNLAGQKVKPTQIISLLTQNPGKFSESHTYERHEFQESTRPASLIGQAEADDGYYKKAANRNLASFLAETEPNYYLIEENSPHRLKFRCPNSPKLSYIRGDLTVYVDPDNDRVRWACPRCSHIGSTKRLTIEDAKVLGKRFRVGSRTFGIFHDVPRKLRQELADDGIIPGKEFTYKDRIAEIPQLLWYIMDNPGLSFYEIDRGLEWANGTAERLINKHLIGKVDLRRERKGRKGYNIYIKH